MTEVEVADGGGGVDDAERLLHAWDSDPHPTPTDLPSSSPIAYSGPARDSQKAASPHGTAGQGARRGRRGRGAPTPSSAPATGASPDAAASPVRRPGADFYDSRRSTATKKRHHVLELEALCYRVTLEPAA